MLLNAPSIMLKKLRIQLETGEYKVPYNLIFIPYRNIFKSRFSSPKFQSPFTSSQQPWYHRKWYCFPFPFLYSSPQPLYSFLLYINWYYSLTDLWGIRNYIHPWKYKNVLCLKFVIQTETLVFDVVHYHDQCCGSGSVSFRPPG